MRCGHCRASARRSSAVCGNRDATPGCVIVPYERVRYRLTASSIPEPWADRRRDADLDAVHDGDY